ncbi:Uncharacterized protein Adt_14427 [Abeliophyllum distichum]|uniref:Uncharacterized protein n=1 Tax=Abeliophyllum distichum TaxID=126358 RepID=A0ABD1U0M4_9LAMI
MGHIIDHCRVEAPPVNTVVTQASKPFVTSAPKPTVASTSKPDVVPATNPCLSSNENVEASIPSDTASSIQLEVHLPGIFCRNSSDDLVGLDERQEADGFTAVHRKKNLKVPRSIKRLTRS